MTGNDYAKALTEVNQMQQDLLEAKADNAALRRELDRCTDRVSMLNEERVRYREDALIFRNKLVELATIQTNIGLMTGQAESVLNTVRELTMRDTQPETKPQQEIEETEESKVNRAREIEQLKHYKDQTDSRALAGVEAALSGGTSEGVAH